MTDRSIDLMLRESDIKPTKDVIAEALGEAIIAYEVFLKELDRIDVQLEWRYYNDGKAWLAKGVTRWTGARGGQNQTTVFWLSIWTGLFKVTFYIPERFRSDALELPVGDEAREMIRNARQMGTRLKYFPLVFELSSRERFDDVLQLADFRNKLK